MLSGQTCAESPFTNHSKASDCAVPELKKLMLDKSKQISSSCSRLWLAVMPLQILAAVGGAVVGKGVGGGVGGGVGWRVGDPVGGGVGGGVGCFVGEEVPPRTVGPGVGGGVGNGVGGLVGGLVGCRVGDGVLPGKGCGVGNEVSYSIKTKQFQDEKQEKTKYVWEDVSVCFQNTHHTELSLSDFQHFT
mmetsp:Transcript_28183/g.68610  ORF Transcript_28183/g.68610 Transcript_28183/m.68610 type:complete len:189 (+) Transcript_28183:969-1535(+)